MNEISSAIAEAIRKRAASITLGTYLFFWMAYHWQGLYVTFFVNQDLIYNQHGLLKNEYVNKYFFGFHGVQDWQFYLGFIIPLVLTYIFIWHVPRYILIRAYRQEQRHKVHRRIIKAEEEHNLQKAEENLAKQEIRTIQAGIDTSEKKKEATKKDPTILWGEEFNDIKHSTQYNYLNDIFKSVYEYKGRTSVHDEYGEDIFTLNPNSLRFGDSRSIVDMIDNGNRIELTDKGKYFAAQYDEKF